MADAEATANVLAGAAFDHLMQEHPVRGGGDAADRKLNSAEAVLATMPEDPRREGRVEEAEHRLADALTLYRQAGADEDAQRLIVRLALWEERQGVDPKRVQDQEWFLGIERTVTEAPTGIEERVGDADRARLQKAMLALLKKVGDGD